MVVLHVKKNDSLFLFQTNLECSVDDTLQSILCIYNGRLKIERICSEMSELSNYGIYMPSKMQGLLEEQIEELKLTDDQAAICTPSGGYHLNSDPCQRRNGRQPTKEMGEVLERTIQEAKANISKENVKKNFCLT